MNLPLLFLAGAVGYQAGRMTPVACPRCGAPMQLVDDVSQLPAGTPAVAAAAVHQAIAAGASAWLHQLGSHVAAYAAEAGSARHLVTFRLPNEGAPASSGPDTVSGSCCPSPGPY